MAVLTLMRLLLTVQLSYLETNLKTLEIFCSWVLLLFLLALKLLAEP